MAGLSYERALWLSRHILPHEPALREWLKRRRLPGLDVDDIVQETYARLASLKSFDDIKQPRSYFFQAAHSVIVSHLRRSRIVSIRAFEDAEALALAADEPSPELQLEFRDELRVIAEALASLPGTCREVFILRRVEGLSQREVGERLGLSENIVEHHMAKGIRLLMNLFGHGGRRDPRSSKGRKDQPTERHARTRNKPTD